MYVECGTDLDLKWVYDDITTVDAITWFANGLKIATYFSTSGFSIIQNANYLPVKEARFAYINGAGSAGVTIKSVKLADESTINVHVDYKNLISLISTTKINVIGEFVYFAGLFEKFSLVFVYHSNISLFKHFDA